MLKKVLRFVFLRVVFGIGRLFLASVSADISEFSLHAGQYVKLDDGCSPLCVGWQMGFRGLTFFMVTSILSSEIFHPLLYFCPDCRQLFFAPDFTSCVVLRPRSGSSP